MSLEEFKTCAFMTFLYHMMAHMCLTCLCSYTPERILGLSCINSTLVFVLDSVGGIWTLGVTLRNGKVI